MTASVYSAKRRVAALDVDGVLLDCDGSFQRVAQDTLGRKLPKLVPSYDLTKRYGLTQEEADLVWIQMDDHHKGWGGMPDLPGAVAAALKLRDEGYLLELVTAIPNTLQEARLRCLAEHGLVPDGIHCAGHHAASKADIIAMLEPEVMVDDRLAHLYAAPGDIQRIWVDHGDEQDGLTPDHRVIRVTSLAEWVNGRPRTPDAVRMPRGR